MIKLIKTTVMILAVLLISSVSVSAADSGNTAGKVNTESTALNIRSGRSISSKVIKTAKKGSYLTLTQKQGNWYKTEYAKDKYGYVHADFIKPVSASYEANVDTKSGNLNVRNGRGTSYKIITTLRKGTDVVVIKDYGEWSRILYSGSKTGYAKSEFLEKVKEKNYKKITLNVPSYKQTDPRWANIKIGTQGDTVKKSGCTTTALAMTESYRLGKAVTPKDMVSRLSYAPSGILYWPSNYIVNTVSSDYLDRIYNELKNGKPVVFGMKTKSGSQHWVVVTGHAKDSGALSASSFTINDPGSDTRTLLSEVMAKYPNPYKIAVAK